MKLLKVDAISFLLLRNKYSTVAKSLSSINVNNKTFVTDDYTNVTPKIISYLNTNLHLQKGHPLSIVRQRIVNYFYSSFTRRGNPIFSVYDNISPIVSTKQNFDDLLIPNDHPSRAKSDCYYINRSTLLRAHMTAHQSDLLAAGLDNFLMIGDVYRRDEIDATHNPVFHQVSLRCMYKDVKRKNKLIIKKLKINTVKSYNYPYYYMIVLG